MTTISKHKRGGWYCYISTAGVRQSIYLGKVTKAQAEFIRDRIEAIRIGNRNGLEPDEKTSAWLIRCDKKLLDKLSALGLLCHWSKPVAMTLGQAWDSYVVSRTDFSQSTLKGFGTARKHAVGQLGDIDLSSITVADAKQFARDFAAVHASSHAKKVIERTWQVFGWAVDSKLLTSNPFAGVNVQATTNKERQFYLTPQATQHVLAGCDHQDIRTIFVLARFCGLRIPHEALALTWEDIDFENRRLRIAKETKTGSRVVPMLGAIHELETHYNLSSKTGFVFVRARASAATTWRGWLLDAIKNANLHGWEKLWINLRASARTDAGNKFASHACREWFGHSDRVAEEHYLMLTASDWATAFELSEQKP